MKKTFKKIIIIFVMLFMFVGILPQNNVSATQIEVPEDLRLSELELRQFMRMVQDDINLIKFSAFMKTQGSQNNLFKEYYEDLRAKGKLPEQTNAKMQKHYNNAMALALLGIVIETINWNNVVEDIKYNYDIKTQQSLTEMLITKWNFNPNRMGNPFVDYTHLDQWGTKLLNFLGLDLTDEEGKEIYVEGWGAINKWVKDLLGNQSGLQTLPESNLFDILNSGNYTYKGMKTSIPQGHIYIMPVGTKLCCHDNHYILDGKIIYPMREGFPANFTYSMEQINETQIRQIRHWLPNGELWIEEIFDYRIEIVVFLERSPMTGIGDNKLVDWQIGGLSGLSDTVRIPEQTIDNLTELISDIIKDVIDELIRNGIITPTVPIEIPEINPDIEDEDEKFDDWWRRLVPPQVIPGTPPQVTPGTPPQVIPGTPPIITTNPNPQQPVTKPCPDCGTQTITGQPCPNPDCPTKRKPCPVPCPFPYPCPNPGPCPAPQPKPPTFPSPCPKCPPQIHPTDDPVPCPDPTCPYHPDHPNNPYKPPPGGGKKPNITFAMFPFCLPWDVYHLVKTLGGGAIEPVFEFAPFSHIGVNTVIRIDFQRFQYVINISKWVQRVGFIMTLMVLTRKFLWTGGGQ